MNWNQVLPLTPLYDNAGSYAIYPGVRPVQSIVIVGLLIIFCCIPCRFANHSASKLGLALTMWVVGLTLGLSVVAGTHLSPLTSPEEVALFPVLTLICLGIPLIGVAPLWKAAASCRSCK